MAEGSLKVLVREETGKQAAKNLRRQGYVPGVLYGSGIEPTPLSIDTKDLLSLLHTFGRNVVVNLTLGKSRKKIKSFIYDIQHHPISGEITHVDLKRIAMDEKIHVTVPVHLSGMPWGVKNEGGIVEHMLHTIEISCLPSDIPEEINVDISEMRLGDVIHVRDLAHEKFEILSDEESVVVHIIAPKVTKAEAAAEAAEAEEEEFEAPEPEVIGETTEGEEG